MDLSIINEAIDQVQTDVIVNGNLKKDVNRSVVSSLGLIKGELKKYKPEGIIDVDGVNDEELDFFEWLNAPDYAETTHIPIYDRQYKWKRGYQTAWTGYSAEGKSTWLYFLLLIKLLKNPKAKLAVFSPENFPRNRLVKDWVKTIIGKDPNIDKELTIFF